MQGIFFKNIVQRREIYPSVPLHPGHFGKVSFSLSSYLSVGRTERITQLPTHPEMKKRKRRRKGSKRSRLGRHNTGKEEEEGETIFPKENWSKKKIEAHSPGFPE